MSEAEVVTVMEQELGVPWEDVFATIEAQPMAAGTIGQAHRATLDSGERVVVKVQRPTAAHDIMRDLGLLEVFAEKTGARPGLRRLVDLPAVVEHLSDSLRRELDFRLEAQNMERMRTILEDYEHLGVPEVYAELSTSRLLVMQEIQGGSIRQAPHGKARREAARELLESYYRQILVEGFFHADPHPGNMLWWRDRVYLLDFGMVGEVDQDTREHLLLMLSGEEHRSDVDVAGMQRDIGALITQMHRSNSLQDIQLGPVIQGLTEIATAHDVRLPSALALTGKALAQMQLAAAELDPDLDPFAVAGRFLTRSLAGRMRGRLDPQSIAFDAQKARVRLGRLADAVERIAGSRPGQKLQVGVFGLEQFEQTIRAAARRLALAITGGACIIGAAFTAESTVVGAWLPIMFGAVGGLLIVGLVFDLLRR
jgi:predicted unusual protein kinase regulating ubiquinone biosynthesis (AarF/ABC1/UbiB family)